MVQRGRKVLRSMSEMKLKWQTEVQGVLYAMHEGLIVTAASGPALKVHIVCFLVGKLVTT